MKRSDFFYISPEQFACYYLKIVPRHQKKLLVKENGERGEVIEKKHTSKLYCMNSWMKTGAVVNIISLKVPSH